MSAKNRTVGKDSDSDSDRLYTALAPARPLCPEDYPDTCQLRIFASGPRAH
jgi:hypothetical protein